MSGGRSKIIEEFIDSHVDELVAEELKDYYNTVKDNDDPDLAWAIDRVLKDYMVNEDYVAWRKEQGKV